MSLFFRKPFRSGLGRISSMVLPRLTRDHRSGVSSMPSQSSMTTKMSFSFASPHTESFPARARQTHDGKHRCIDTAGARAAAYSGSTPSAQIPKQIHQMSSLFVKRHNGCQGLPTSGTQYLLPAQWGRCDDIGIAKVRLAQDNEYPVSIHVAGRRTGQGFEQGCPETDCIDQRDPDRLPTKNGMPEPSARSSERAATEGWVQMKRASSLASKREETISRYEHGASYRERFRRGASSSK